jgi:hypothetical protein
MRIARRIKRRIWPQVRFRVDPNSTHHDFLVASIDFIISRNPENSQIVMIEVGTGGTSSRVMQSYLDRFSQIRLISFENDLKWLLTYEQDYPRSDRHSLAFVEDNSWTSTIEKYLTDVPESSKILAFIDSSPWESRIQALKVLRARSDLFLIHDVDYFPHNGLMGREIEPIKYAPANPFFYGKLKSKNLGLRDYDKVAKYWVEAFPRIPGYFTGPPTLIASEKLDVREVEFPKGVIKQSESGGV